MPREDDHQVGEGDWSYYWAAMDGRAPALTSDSQIEPGYYRRRPKVGPSEPVMILVEDGVYIAERNGKAVPSDKIAELFRWVCRNPVSYDAFVLARDGGGWADEPPAMIGHNLPKDADPLDKIRFEFEAELEQIEEMLKKPVENQDEADRLGIWKTKIVALLKAAEAAQTIELAPVEQERQRIRARWGALLGSAAAVRDRVLDHVEPWLKKQRELERERQETARRNAEMLRAKHQEMVKAAAELPAGKRDAAIDAATAVLGEAQAADKEAELHNPQAGRKHAKVKMVTRVRAEIFDYDVTLNHVKDDRDIRARVQSLANMAIKSNPLPGTRRVEVHGVQ